MKESIDRYLKTYSGQNLLKEYSLYVSGIWQIYGEDPNCDMGGAHFTPLLDTVEGTLEEAIEYGVSLPRFWQWGSGGRFELITVKPARAAIESGKERAKLQAEIDVLQKRLKELK